MTTHNNPWPYVYEYFDQNFEKTLDWFVTRNPMLGGVSPYEMLKRGRSEKLLQFIKTSISENKECENETPD